MLPLILLGCILVVHDDDDTHAPVTCGEIEEAFRDELARVQTCEEAAACGQVLPGTSCGCTRNLVARLDADVERLYELIDLAATQGCDLGLTSPCDCPEADGFACDDGTCAWSYVDGAALPACRAADGDPYELLDAWILGDRLLATASAGGGCEDHDWTLCWPDGAFMESWPVQARLEILHDDNDDPCDAIITEDLSFDLLPLQAAWHDSYGGDAGTIVIRLDGYSLDYAF